MSNSIPDEIDSVGWLRRAAPMQRISFIWLLLSLVVLTAAAWALTLSQTIMASAPMGIGVRGGVASDGMAGMAMAGMPQGGWSVAAVVAFIAVWTVMMAAMMLPAIAPMLLMFASVNARGKNESAISIWIFGAGYILIWAAVGLSAYAAVQIGSDVAARLVPMERMRWAPIALGITLVAAGLYQFTSLKRFCLRHCRSPLAFVVQHWRDGRLGAARMGIEHGLYCLGCCWVLFAVLVAAGVMSLAWMLLLTLIIFIEKAVPWGRQASALAGMIFVATGVAVAAGFSLPL